VNTSPVTRIIDENLNRLAEGLRVLEDIARMVLNDSELTTRLKTLRHSLVRADLPFNLALLRARDAAGDVGAALEAPGQNEPRPLSIIVIANARRAQESLRVLEETAKLPEIAGQLDSHTFQQARFTLYSIEKELAARLTRKEMRRQIHGLYVVLDTAVLKGRSPLEAAGELVQAGVKIIQLRDKTTAKKQLLPVARAVAALCRRHGVLFIINDYLDIALAAEADGLHIGQTDLPAEDARRLLSPDKILGVSVTTVAEARAAEIAGADYLGVGAVYPTASKDDAPPVGVERIQKIRQGVTLPLAAIGGINLNNVKEVVAAGADVICVISAVLNAQDIQAAARQMITLISDKN
jgi:thiamine-phosphate pyrophosphorylase